MGILTNPQTRSLDTGVFLSTLLTYQFSDQDDAILAALAADSGPPNRIYVNKDTATRPRIAAYHGFTYDLVLLGGVTNLTNTAAFYDGYAGDRRGQGRTLSNGYVDDLAFALAQELADRGIGVSSNVTIAGHSMGGAVGQALTLVMNGNNPNIIPNWVTFGGPKAGATQVRDALNRLPGIRFFTPEDPVPLFPLTVDEAPWLAFFFSAEQMAATGSWVQPHGGLEVDDQGGLTPAEKPSNAALSPITSLFAWIVSLDGTELNNHSIATYQGRLRKAQTLSPTPHANVTPLGQEERPQTFTRQYVQQRGAAYETAIFDQSRQQTAAFVSVPTAQAFRAARVGGVWYVLFGDLTIAAAPHRRGARSTARQMNAAFRQYQSVALADPGAFIERLTAYLQVASDPAGGFNPVLPVTVRGF
jgi:pimeloyl-ACP methyl ester carboxylesterase